jgi:hypothetical protein
MKAMRWVIGSVTLVAVVGVGWWSMSQEKAGCRSDVVTSVLCVSAGTRVLEPLDRGSETVTLPTIAGGDMTVNAEDLLAVGGPDRLRTVDGGPDSSTGDPVLDQFVLVTREYLSEQARSEVALEVVAVPGTSGAVPAAWEAIAPVVDRLFGKDLAGMALPMFVTDHRDSGLAAVTELAKDRDCRLSDHVRERVVGKATGARYDMEMCGDGPGLYFDMWQYLHLPGWDNPGALMQTISDEVMTVWERRVQSGTRSGETVPFWLYEGSQTLPFLLHSANRLSIPLFDGVSDECREATLTDLEWEGYVPGSQQSCPHQLGSAAMVLLVARVGVEPVLDYFRADPTRPHEDRFMEMAGESPEEFASRFSDWMITREGSGTRDPRRATTDGATYHEHGRRWLGA